MTALQAFTNHEFGTIRTITSGGQMGLLKVWLSLGFMPPV